MTRPGILRSEMAFWFGAVTTVLFLVFGKHWLSDLHTPWQSGLLFAWLFVAMLWLAFGVVRHADGLAVLLGEPYGTLILTVAVISIEVVMITAVTLTGDSNPGLARDTMFAVLMIVLNGMVGVSMLLGGLRHREQAYNLSGATAYLGVLVPLATITLVLPRFTTSAPGGQASALFSIFLIVMSLGLYGVFLGIQTIRHRGFFAQPPAGDAVVALDHAPAPEHDAHATRSVPYHAVFLVLTMLPIVLLSKSMAKLVEHGISVAGAPAALGGFLVAILVLSPEALAGFRAARANLMQRSINIAYGSALATIGLTVPAVLTVGFFTGKPIDLGLDTVELVILVVTLATAVINTNAGRTNILQGVVHLLLFLTYVVLIFD